MNCQDNSRLKVPLPELCKTTDIGCVPATDGRPDCPPEADQLPLAYDINSQTLWIFSCESRNWTPLTKFSLAELQEVSLDNLRNICNLVNVPVFYNLGQGTIQGSLSLGELAEKIAECRGITPGPTPAEDKNDITVVEAGENVTVSSNKVGDVTTYTVNALSGSGSIGSLTYRKNSDAYPFSHFIDFGGRTDPRFPYGSVEIDCDKNEIMVNHNFDSVAYSRSDRDERVGYTEISLRNPYSSDVCFQIILSLYLAFGGITDDEEYPVLKGTVINSTYRLTTIKNEIYSSVSGRRTDTDTSFNCSLVLPAVRTDHILSPDTGGWGGRYFSQGSFVYCGILERNANVTYYLKRFLTIFSTDNLSRLSLSDYLQWKILIFPNPINIENGTHRGNT